MINNISINKICAEYRKKVLQMSLNDVARDIGCTPQNIYAFEHGKTNSGRILQYYLSKGVTLNE